MRVSILLLIFVSALFSAQDTSIPGPAYVGIDPGAGPAGTQFFRIGGSTRIAPAVGTSLGDDLVIGTSSTYATGLKIYNSNYLANKFWLIGHDSLGGLSINNNGVDLLSMGRNGGDTLNFNGSAATFNGVVSASTLCAAQALKIGIALADNRSNAQAQIRGSMIATAPDNNNISEVIAADVNYYNNGSPTWRGLVNRFYGTGVAGNEYDFPRASTGMLLGQNVGRLAIGVNGYMPMHFFNAMGTRLKILGTGDVVIGSSDPQGTGVLRVDGGADIKGTVRTKEVVVTLLGWADYVFDPHYELMPLSEVAERVTADRHLPGVPSASEVIRDGVSLGDMQAIHMRKIEELTLYAIAADAAAQKQSSRADGLERELALQRSRIAQLEADKIEQQKRLERIEAVLQHR